MYVKTKGISQDSTCLFCYIMPTLAFIYLILYFLTVVGGAWYVSRFSFPTHLLVFDGIASVTLAYLYCGYWIPEIIQKISWGAPLALVLVIVWSLYNWRKIYSDPKFISQILETERSENSELFQDTPESSVQIQSAARVSLYVTILCNLPAYIFATLAVAQGFQSQK